MVGENLVQAAAAEDRVRLRDRNEGSRTETWGQLTHDEAFDQWANKVRNLGSGMGSEVSLKDFRKNITIKLLNEAGRVAISYNVFRCWVSQYQALPELDAGANAVAIQTLTLQHEGWERDESVTDTEEQAV